MNEQPKIDELYLDPERPDVKATRGASARAPWWAAPAGWALIAAVLLWRLPSLALALAGRLVGRLRFLAASGLVGALRALGCRGATQAVLRAELRRCRRRMAGLARARLR